MKKLLVLLALTFVAISFAAKAPTHRSIRAEAMGNAHVALVDDKEAIYFNYAGLNQINRLGNYEERQLGEKLATWAEQAPLRPTFQPTTSQKMSRKSIAEQARSQKKKA